MQYKTANNFSTDPIFDLEAMEYIKYRAAYDYPKAYAERAVQGNHDIQLTPDLFARFVVPNQDQRTDLWLDNYHYSLLRSGSAEDRLLGITSVVYWGYFTFGDSYARNKVDWLINGNKGQPATTSAMAFAHTTAAINHLDQKCIGEAMFSLQGLSQLNRTPFASKVIAFMAPSAAGVYDNRIADGLSLHSWAANFSKGIGQTNSPQVRSCYQSWCIYLTQIASQLNLGISLGKEWMWSCGDDQGEVWRALDVERAIFAMFGATPANAAK
ncbi:hypothetical protein HG264_13960 [Pseudomonas sp. gcc21]|uniref:hypothetical protein n=1 Tax=Pseudomonas sp. gcc21 TaxID=2726989 RepID=UPI001451E4C4|nr:hypothetical protein [Pseudomonas sp. gcc21]QJD59929.1 hypothetical protein HG264_13960 [Pseudomonas sp. gcc21]